MASILTPVKGAKIRIGLDSTPETSPSGTAATAVTSKTMTTETQLPLHPVIQAPSDSKETSGNAPVQGPLDEATNPPDAAEAGVVPASSKVCSKKLMQGEVVAELRVLDPCSDDTGLEGAQPPDSRDSTLCITGNQDLKASSPPQVLASCTHAGLSSPQNTLYPSSDLLRPTSVPGHSSADHWGRR